MTASSWPLRTAIALPVAASQTRAVLSYEAVTMRAPSGEKAALLTESSWPLRTLRSRNSRTAALKASIATSSLGR